MLPVDNMIKFGVVVSLALLVTAAPNQIYDRILEGTELEFAFLIHRHGDRTPIESQLVFSNDPKNVTRLAAPYGWGQLTENGKRNSYNMGKDIRKRYGSLISPQYNRSQIYMRSTDSTRAKMTVLTAAAAIYPPGPNSWSDKLKWEPVPYTTVPGKWDFNLPFINCPKLMKAQGALYTTSTPALQRYQNVLQLLTRKIGIDFNASPVMSYLAYDVFASQLSLGVPLDPEIQAALPDISKTAGEAIDVLFGNPDYIPLEAGVLLNEFLTYAKDVANGVDTQKLRIYSAHDVSVYAFEAVTQISKRQGVPKYCSTYALELRRFKSTGIYIVLPVYIRSPGEKPVYLQVAGCGNLCTLEQFANITAPFAMDVDTWRTECGFTDDLVVDAASIA